MSTLFYSDPACLDHITPQGHAERPARLVAILNALEAPRFAALIRRDAPPADPAEVLRCHPQSHLDAIRAAVPTAGTVQIDEDTHLSPGSLTAALAGLGQALAATDAVIAGEAKNAFAAIRPPGHHAETAKTMGFCLFGTVAIAAKRALDLHGLSRVALVDFDVHHGNGTQDLLWNEARIFFVSSQQFPLWPGTGSASEQGAHGQILNLPLAPGSGGAAFRAAYEAQVFPALEAFRPELLIVSAGFDAHRADPLAQLELEVEDYEWLTHRLCDIADAHCGGRLVSVLEGGYDLEALAASASAHIAVLMERGA